VDFRILGPLAVVDDDGHDVPVPGARLRALLALVIVRAGDTVSADRLADDLWGDDLPAGWNNALQSLVSKLRRTVDPASSLLMTDSHGYRLELAPEQIDARRFEALAAHARAALVGGDFSAAAQDSNRALALWRGAALDGLADDGVLRHEATRLEALRLAVLEDRFDAELHLGRHAEVLHEIEASAAAHPLRERLHGFVMLALYRAGRQGDALRAYQHARHVLAEELGLEPGPQLRVLESAILNQDPTLDLAPTTPAPTRRPRTNVTPRLSSFVGRVDDLRALGKLVARHRLVTVVGPGGAGKTRLATETALRRSGDDEAWFVELAPLHSADGVADTIAAVLGAADAIGGTAAGVARPATDRVVEHIGERAMLIVLDNCEHVIDEAARVTERLLATCPNIRVLATSREPLALHGETIWPVPAMSTDDAVALFVDRAGASSGFQLEPAGDAADSTAAIVTELCTRLDGLPLAIELAAGRVRTIPVRQLASRLDDRFRILTGGSRTALPRQQTLRAVVEWSYDLLFDDEQRVFDRLSVFAGGCTLAAAEHVCAGDDIATEDVADLLAHLVDKSLVIADQSGPEVRFRLLQTLALYGLERLVACGDAGQTRDRHADHYADLCARGVPAFRGPDQEPWLTETEFELDNVLAALTWRTDQARAEAVHTMLAGFGWSWWFAGRGDVGWRWMTAGLDCPGETTPRARCGAARWTAYVGASAGAPLADATRYGEEAVWLARSLDDVDELAESQMLLAGIYGMAGRNDEAIPAYDEAQQLYSLGDGEWNQALAANAAGRAAELRGDIALGFDLQRASVDHFEACGADWALAIINGDVGLLAMRLGRYEVAYERTSVARQAARYLRLFGYEAVLISRLVNFALGIGDIDLADSMIDEGLAMSEEARYRSAEAFNRLGQAIVRRTQGRLDEAAAAATTALTMFQTMGLEPAVAHAHCVVGSIAARAGDHASARASYLNAIDTARRTEVHRWAALALEGLAEMALTNGDASGAARLLGAASVEQTADGGGGSGPESSVGPTTDAARTQLGQAMFDEWFQRGVVDPGITLPATAAG
jgi:predicted ATPase/DNA-binding SARP family transcriptional activator